MAGIWGKKGPLTLDSVAPNRYDVGANKMSPAELQVYSDEHIPYRMKAIAWGLDLLRSTWGWTEPKKMEVVIEGKLFITGYHPALTNPSIEMAIVYSRVLLEFLGLKADKEKKELKEVWKRRKRDVGIEHFQKDGVPLKRVTKAEAVATCAGKKEDAERALLVLIGHADKAVAHLTEGPIQDGRTRDLVELGCSGVLTLVHKTFYQQLGIEPSKTTNSFRRSPE
jgi:hypothetical protein